MENSYEFSLYGGCVDQVYGPSGYVYAPPITTVGSVLSDIVYDSEYYSVQSNFEVPVISVQEGGTTYYSYPYVYYGPVYYVYDVPVVLHYQVLEEPCAPEESCSEELSYGHRYSDLAGFELNPVFSVEERGATFYYYPYMYYGPMYYVYDVPVVLHYQVLEEPCAPEKSWSEELSYGHRYSDLAGDVCPYAAPKTPSEALTSFEIYYEEEGERLNDAPFNSDKKKKKDDDKKNDGDRKNEDNNGVSSLGQNKSMNPDCVNESLAYKKFCSEMEERRKLIGASSQVKKTFINRGVVADPIEYKKFCDSVEDRLKKLRESSPEKKTTTDRDAVKASYTKFYSTVEERRTILNDSSVGKKSFVNRGVVADPLEYRKFCRSVEDRIKNLGSSENSQSLDVKDFIANRGSKVVHEKRIVHEGSSNSFMDMILKSAEYFHVQDNLKNTKHYRDLLYKQALNKQNKATLMEILPSIVEESFNVDDVTAECGELHVAEPRELDSNDEHKPVIIKTKQPKNRLKSFRNWLAKTFCCCCTTNQPP